MDVLIIINKKQVDELHNQLKERRLPFKIAIQNIYPLRSLDSNAYYWGIVLKYISDATGHTQEECHKAFKKKYNFRYDILYNNSKRMWLWKMGTSTTTILDSIEIWEYLMKIRAEAEVEMGIVIPMPNETMINELKFEKEI